MPQPLPHSQPDLQTARPKKPRTIRRHLRRLGTAAMYALIRGAATGAGGALVTGVIYWATRSPRT